MRPINIRQLRREADLTIIDNARATLAALSETERGGFIDANGDAWSYLRPALWRIGYLKCWYSEAILQAGEGQVEHFRPKKRLWGARHSGYWWRAFDWENLRLAHVTVNIRREDYITGEMAGKGCYFPLCNNAQRANNLLDEQNEEPLLLDPIKPNDCKLLCFDTDTGKPLPRFLAEEDELKFRRAKASIDFYHLDEGTWNYRRKDLMDDVSVLCDLILDAKVVGDLEKEDRLMNELIIDYIDPRAEFSSAVMQVVREKGLLEAAVA